MYCFDNPATLAPLQTSISFSLLVSAAAACLAQAISAYSPTQPPRLPMFADVRRRYDQEQPAPRIIP